MVFYYIKRLKILVLKNHHRLARVEWAKTMLSNRDGNIIFSDEKKFDTNGHQFYWLVDLRLEKETFFSRNHGEGSLMILEEFPVKD